MFAMVRARIKRHQKIDRLAEKLFARITKKPQRLGVHERYLPGHIGHDHAARACLDGQANSLFRELTNGHVTARCSLRVARTTGTKQSKANLIFNCLKKPGGYVLVRSDGL